jgi:putative transposase
VILDLIDEAQREGARLDAACKLLGISTRTIERWRCRPGGDDSRMGPRHLPRNSLTDAERAKIIAVMTSPENAGISPKQLVPQLADRGIYLASESTLYRLQRRLGAGTRRRRLTHAHVTRAVTVHRAGRPNQVWSWDITYLPTVVRGRFLYQ